MEQKVRRRGYDMLQLIYKYKDSLEIKICLFEDQDKLYEFIKKEDIMVEQIIDTDNDTL